jgi:hypothetical protein
VDEPEENANQQDLEISPIESERIRIDGKQSMEENILPSLSSARNTQRRLHLNSGLNS